MLTDWVIGVAFRSGFPFLKVKCFPIFDKLASRGVIGFFDPPVNSLHGSTTSNITRSTSDQHDECNLVLKIKINQLGCNHTRLCDRSELSSRLLYPSLTSKFTNYDYEWDHASGSKLPRVPRLKNMQHSFHIAREIHLITPDN